jgi:acetoin utilization protein AcuB
MKQNRIRHIPIVKHDHILVGIITERDVKDASPSIFQLKMREDFLDRPIKSIMKTNVITGHPLDFVEELAAVLIENKIGCLPILQDDKLVGLLTETDVLSTFVKLTGADHPSSRIEVKVPNRAGMLAEVSAIFQKRRVNISSVLVYPDSNEYSKILVFRVQSMNVSMIISDLKAEGYEVLWPNVSGNMR